jgi:hypothetical protein
MPKKEFKPVLETDSQSFQFEKKIHEKDNKDNYLYLSNKEQIELQINQ